MSVLGTVLGGLFGEGRNVVAETAEVFRINSEAEAQRGSEMRASALAQFAQEFQQQNRGGFDRFMDGVNRIPRPALAFGTLGLFLSAMYDPVWFSERMLGLAVVPEPLWWLLGAIVSFYFGARHQAKGQDFSRNLMKAASLAPHLIAKSDKQNTVPDAADAVEGQREINPALQDWKKAS